MENTNDVFIKTQEVKKTYSNTVQALKGVNVEIKEGEIISLIGSSGAGKTTFLRCLNGLIKPTEGIIEVNGRDITKLDGKALRKYQKKVGIIFQQFNLVKRLSVIKNVLIGSLINKEGKEFFKALLGVFDEGEKEKAFYYLDKVGILDQVWKRVDQLSGGQKQRVGIAKTLLQSPDLILADEPIASLDPYSSISVMENLQQINKEFGTTIIMNMHYLDYAKKYSTRILGLKHGKLVFDGTPEDLNENAEDYIYSGANIEEYKAGNEEWLFDKCCEI